MVDEDKEAKPKKEKIVPTEEQLAERKKLETEIAEAKKILQPITTKISELNKKLKELPKPVVEKKAKVKTALSDTMKIAQSVGKSVKDNKKTPSKGELRKKCSTIVGLESAEKITRSQVDAVVREGLALLETMPKDPPKPKPEGGKPKETKPAEKVAQTA